MVLLLCRWAQLPAENFVVAMQIKGVIPTCNAPIWGLGSVSGSTRRFRIFAAVTILKRESGYVVFRNLVETLI